MATERHENTGTADSDSESLQLDAVFTEPDRPSTPEATFSTYKRKRYDETDCDIVNEDNGEVKGTSPPSSSNNWSEIHIRLVGSHPLWGHYLWNASRSFASFLDENAHLYAKKSVLELGAGGGLPGIVTALNGAHKTVLTDYPDKDLVDNLRYNVEQNTISLGLRDRVEVLGYLWGASVEPLLHAASSSEGFDLIILSDLIFNHSQHDALLTTCEKALRTAKSSHVPLATRERSSGIYEPCVLVFYTHHRPKFAARDMEFFARANSRGWLCEEVVTEKFEPMFPDDPGEKEIRSTVHGWRLLRKASM